MLCPASSEQRSNGATRSLPGTIMFERLTVIMESDVRVRNSEERRTGGKVGMIVAMTPIASSRSPAIDRNSCSLQR